MTVDEDPGVSFEPMEVTPASLAIYSTVAARRGVFDSLLWQVPVLSLTAQAFLFSTMLAADSAWWARAVSALLSVNVTVLSILLMARHRQSELSDAHWLADFEQRIMKVGEWAPHGPSFRQRRALVTDLKAGWVGRILPLRPMFGVWVLGLALRSLRPRGSRRDAGPAPLVTACTRFTARSALGPISWPHNAAPPPHARREERVWVPSGSSRDMDTAGDR